MASSSSSPAAKAFPDKVVAHLLGSNGPIHTVAYSASPGTYILTGSADRSIRLYNPLPDQSASGKSRSSVTKSGAAAAAAAAGTATAVPQARLIQTYSAHGYEVLALAVAPSNERFASAGGDRNVFWWDVATARTIRHFGGKHGHTSRVNAVALGGVPDGDSVIVSGGADTRVHVWDGRSGSQRPVQTMAEARDAITSLAVGDAEILAGSVDGWVRAYDVRAGRVVADAIGTSVTALCPARDWRSVLVGGLDSTLRLMDRERGKCLQRYGADGWRNEELRVQSVLGGGEKWVLAGDEMTAPAPAAVDLSGRQEEGGAEGGGASDDDGAGRVWVWDLLSAKVVRKLSVPWGPVGWEGNRRKTVVSWDGTERERKNVVSCLAWKEDGWGDQFCVGGTSGVVTVFGT